MSDQSRNRNEENHGQGGAGKRLEMTTGQSLSPQQARKQKERLIMIVMLVLAAVMSAAAAVTVLYSRWVKKPVLPPGPVQSGAPVESGQPADPSAEVTPLPASPTPAPSQDATPRGTGTSARLAS